MNDTERAPALLEQALFRLDDDVDLYLSEAPESERLVASLRIEPMRLARLKALVDTGAAWLPDVDGALVHLAADADGEGEAALVDLLCTACEERSARLDEPAWLARCEPGLLPLLRTLGWRDWPSTPAHAADPALPMVLVLDDLEYLERLRSPLAQALASRSGRADRAVALLAGLGAEREPAARASARSA